MSDLADRTRAVLDALAGSGVLAERRAGQLDMAAAVADAVHDQHHLLIDAGTGTGKTWAYLTPVTLSGAKAVIATATRSLQEQLAQRDLPRARDALDPHLTWSVLKGRSNYVCRERLAEPVPRSADQALLAWAATTATGDRDELPAEPDAAAWRQISVRADECPGAARCPSGAVCFAELARAEAAASRIVITNHHVYATGLWVSHQLLPEHDVVVFDEAHQLDEVFRQASSTRADPVGLFRLVQGGPGSPQEQERLIGALRALERELAPLAGSWLRQVPPRLADALGAAGEDLRHFAARARALARQDGQHRVQRVAHAAALGVENLTLSLGDQTGRAVWIEGDARRPVLRTLAPTVDLPAALARSHPRTIIFASATSDAELPRELGLTSSAVRRLEVPSPFDYSRQALLYCPERIPDPRSPAWTAAVHDELTALITAAGGSTLALFTSWKAVSAAADAVAPRLATEVLVQGALSKHELIERLRAGTGASVFGTIGLAQGTDVPGAALRLVTVDRLPFPPVGDPYLAARRDRLGPRGFTDVDLRQARTALAQIAGRLVRTATDRGVVALFDPRITTARYRAELLRALPPMRRTRDRATVTEFLTSVDVPRGPGG